MKLKTFRVDTNIVYERKIDKKQGFLQVFGVTANNVDEAITIVTTYLEKKIFHKEWKLEIKNSYEAELNDLITTSNFTKMANPCERGIWFFSGKINYKEK